MAFSTIFDNYGWHCKHSSLDNIDTLIGLVEFLFHLWENFTSIKVNWLHI